MNMRYKIPEIRAIPLLACAQERENSELDFSFNTADKSRETFYKWTTQDDCPMFYQAAKIVRSRNYPNARTGDMILSDVFVYIDFSGIFDRNPVGKIEELQRKAEMMFRPEGITLNIQWMPGRYIAFERSANMSRNSKLCFIRDDIYEQLKEHMMLGMTIGRCQLSKLYAYNGLLFTGGQRIYSHNLLTDRRIIVIDNPKSVIRNVKTITVEDDGTDAPVREYHRVEKTMDIEVTEFDGEGLISPELALNIDPMKEQGHPHHSFQIRLPYIKGVVHEVDFRTMLRDLGVHMIVDMWGKWHSIEDVDLILTKSMFKGFGWMTENGLTWAEYLAQCQKYDHALYISGTDSIQEQDMTELNYQFLNTAAISDEEFRPADLPDSWTHTPDWDYRKWLTKATEKAYWDLLGNNSYQRAYYLSFLENPAYQYDFDRRARCELLQKNGLFIDEPIYQRELRNKAASILKKYQNANLLVSGDNRYLSDDLMRLLAVMVEHISEYAYKVLKSETMSGAVFYAPKPAYEPNDMYTLLRNPHIARNEEVIAKPMEPGPLRRKFMGHLHYVVMVDSRSLIPERLGGADYDGDMIKTISDPLMNQCVARNYGDNYENAGNLPLLKIPAAEPIYADANDWKARFETVKATFSSRVGQISNAALRRSIIAYDENSSGEERERCRQETEILAILTGLEIDSAKSGIKPDLSQYLGSNKGQRSLFLRYKNLARRTENRKWYEPTRKKQMDQFFASVQWENVSSNLEKLPYYAYLLEKHLQKVMARPVDDWQLFAFAGDPDWKDKLDPWLLERMRQLISDYEEALHRRKFLRIEPDYMTRQTDVQRILFARNQEDDYTVDELYHSFDRVYQPRIHDIRRRLVGMGWMFTRPEERIALLEELDLPKESIPYWDLFCDFRNGGYRILADIVCDFDDMLSSKEARKHLLEQKGDSEDLHKMLLGISFQPDYRQEIISKCKSCLNHILEPGRIPRSEAVKCAVALGKRQFALEVIPDGVLATVRDRSHIWAPAEQKPKKRRWFWHAE